TFPRHHHPHVQSGTILSGGGRFRVGNSVWEVRAGSSYYVPSDVPHELIAGPKEETVVLDVFTPEREDFEGEVLPPDGP
ncbi:MAG: cupin domain-containing protein, partial [Thermoplasmata archaeon]